MPTGSADRLCWRPQLILRRHEQHDHQLEETLRGAGRDTIADDQGKQVRAKNSQYAADRRPDQPLEAHQAQAPFENHDREPKQRTNSCVQRRRKAEGVKQITGDGDEENKN